MSTILFVVSGARAWTLTDGTHHPTGYWAEELLAPYRLLTEAGHSVVFATPDGLAPVADESSFGSDDSDARAALAAIDDLEAPRSLADTAASEYDALFYPGGHGPMQDLWRDGNSGSILADALDSQKPVALVCHGVAALLSALRPDGELVAKGRRATAFTDDEETQAGLAPLAPFLLESALRDGGVVIETAAPWSDHVVVDANLITGQNPQSSASVARALLSQLGSSQPS